MSSLRNSETPFFPFDYLPTQKTDNQIESIELKLKPFDFECDDYFVNKNKNFNFITCFIILVHKYFDLKTFNLIVQNDYGQLKSILCEIDPCQNYTSFLKITINKLNNLFDNNFSNYKLYLSPNNSKDSSCNFFSIDFKNCEKNKCCVIYDKSRYKYESIKRILDHLSVIVSYVSKNHNISIESIKYYSNNEIDKILKRFNPIATEFNSNKTPLDLIRETFSVKLYNGNIIYKDKNYSYELLDKKSNQLAFELISHGVKKGEIIAILMDRSIEMMISIFAVIKVGGVYLPLSVKQPSSRNDYIINNSNAKFLITLKRFKNKLTEKKQPIFYDSDEWVKNSENQVSEKVTLEDLAYIIYTSGTTGNPKGVMVNNRALLNRIEWMQKCFHLNKEDTILHKTSCTFDVSIWEIYWWAMYGSNLCILSEGDESKPDEIVNVIDKSNISIIHFVPSMLKLFLDYVELEKASSKLISLRRVVCSGEALSNNLVSKFYSIFSNNSELELYNLYGPTEATVDVTFHKCLRNNKTNIVPIGKPIDNIKIIIADKENNIKPIGVPGELYISGVGLANGYVNDERLTNEKFIISKLLGEERFYKTGDLARWLEDGSIEYLGRIDSQVKIRGFRIELSEIQFTLNKHSEIKDSVLIDYLDGNNEKCLIAFIKTNKDIESAEIKKHIEKYLPSYMVPHKYIRIDDIPFTNNGKLDRKKLISIFENKQGESKNRVIENKLEKSLTEIWTKILGSNEFTSNNKFFDIGGTSLKAIQVVMELKKIGHSMGVADVYKYQSIDEMVAFINK